MSADERHPLPQLTVRLSNDLEAIAFARMIVRHVLPPLDDVQEPLFFGALTEVVTNAIEEHQRASSDAEVEMTVTTGPRATISIRDSGGGFDPNATQMPQEGSGLGLMISRAVVPDIDISSGPLGTTVTLPYPSPAS